eukprot:1303-Heterococcus_DN1.PRE.1
MHVQTNAQRLGVQAQAGAQITTMQQQQQSLNRPAVGTSSVNKLATSAPVAAARPTAPTAPAAALYNAAMRQPVAAFASATAVAAARTASSTTSGGYAFRSAAATAASASAAAVSTPPQQARAGARKPTPTELIIVPDTVALELVPVSPEVSVHIASLTGLNPNLRLNAATNKRLALVYNHANKRWAAAAGIGSLKLTAAGAQWGPELGKQRIRALIQLRLRSCTQAYTSSATPLAASLSTCKELLTANANAHSGSYIALTPQAMIYLMNRLYH